MRQVRREDTRSQSMERMVEVNAYYQVFFFPTSSVLREPLHETS